MGEQELTVHLHQLADAKCVAEALGQGDASVMPSRTGWSVSVLPSRRELPDVLDAVHQCLAQNEIPFVRVTIDGRTYAMETAANTNSERGIAPASKGVV